ncbi:MAG TPA: DUF5348 domain-containing protein [Ktedonobacteraceae bacterium]|nr:DUF5348 domain-containing protein [Ktedonobacteraceae bacterium]
MEAEGQLILDPKLGRYKIVGQHGKEDYHLQGGEKLELLTKGQWVRVRIESVPNEQKKNGWKFFNERNEPVFPEAGQRARLVGVTQQQNRM